MKTIRLSCSCRNALRRWKANRFRKAGACLSDYFLYLQHGSKSSFGYGILKDFMVYGGSHQPDEYIECRDFVNCTKAISLFLLRWCDYNICKMEDV